MSSSSNSTSTVNLNGARTTSCNHIPSNDISSTMMRDDMTNIDNFNIAPGHASVVFYSSRNATATTTTTSTDESTSGNIISCSPLTWGLCPLDGTRNNPLPEGPSKHFSNLMFNARADTLYSKKTFSQLALRGQTCIWAVDGYFEWKEEDGNVLKKGGGKQPYFVKGRNDMPLFIPGLWTKVNTGKLIQNTKEEYLETFTIITTEACHALKWMHSRQPILIFYVELARQWLHSPSLEVLEQMVTHSRVMGGNEISSNDWIDWYPVTKQMSKIGYGGQDCIKPIKIEKMSSVKSFFMDPSKMTQASSSRKHLLNSCRVKGKDTIINDSPVVKKSKGNDIEGIKKFLHSTGTTSAGPSSPSKNKHNLSENRKHH
eukprot:CAMPEP_0176501720 /NCGR_PEP_ID=MMETSP0200_2-20121128/14328_1 /TAXON_ID=947934 /ORGANISM="Chaetoceros sp., Strain GSL56" /LENGTH=371 /DNA_ID=CAMNT_0017900659 /DNA_START=175 /DNA_END=1287 /DNA_ORIENTATION=-